jgi:D-alanine-D-alanine ligase
MKKKLRVAILCGGRSAEHEISLLSARSVVGALDRSKYEPVLIGIDRGGRWAKLDIRADRWPKRIAATSSTRALAVALGAAPGRLVTRPTVGRIDVVFPVLHGPFGEDGSVQGLLKLANVPFVGAGVLGSAVGMDKDVLKRLLRDAGVPTARFLTFDRGASAASLSRASDELGLPLFVKPANLGSSVGITKVAAKEKLAAAAAAAFRYDHKIVIEENIRGREIECAVLGNSDPIASVPGEIVPRHEFYSYEAKYLDARGAALVVPARLDAEIVREARDMAIKTFKTLGCEGMARVDFFLTGDRGLIVNEINTIPGFTQISMYPKLWEASGVTYSELIDRLIRLALERYREDRGLKTSYA